MISDHHTQCAQILWDHHCLSEPVEKSDLIVGLGSYDLRVADRCVALHKMAMADVICFTGASGNWTQELYRSSEAEAFAERAMALGVARQNIRLETKAQNIGENVSLTRKMFPDAGAIIWVTKPQTQRRLRATIEAWDLDVVSCVTAPQHGFEDQPTQSHSKRDLICELVGDTWRLAAYPERGFTVSQAMPAAVRDAFGLLVEAGFVDHLPPNVRSLADR